MGKTIAIWIGFIVTSLLIGCSAAPAPVSVPPTAIPATVTPLPVPTNTLAPTIAPTIAPIVAPTAVPATIAPQIIIVTATPQPLPVNTVPRPSPTLQAGLFVESLRVAPDPPVRGNDLDFFPTFVNGTGTVQNTKWVVYIYRTDTPNRSYGETPATTTGIPVGTSEQKNLRGWKLGPGGPCEFFFARVAFLNQDNKAVFFLQTNGKVFEKALTVCPP